MDTNERELKASFTRATKKLSQQGGLKILATLCLCGEFGLISLLVAP
jgi:hypothetical protein